MGADLYLLDREVPILGFEVSDKAVEAGYFSDCYNSWGLFAIMSKTLDETISWWQTSSREELFRRDQDGRLVMTIKGVNQWFGEMFPKVKKFIEAKTLYRNDGYGSEKTVKVKNVDAQQMKEHAQLFLKFITLARDSQSEIHWSV